MQSKLSKLLFLSLFTISLTHFLTAKVTGTHYIAIDPLTKARLSVDFKHLDYVNPNAPIYGTVVLSKFGSFDSLNPFIPKGESASEIVRIYDTLLMDSSDEDNVSYGLLADRIYYDNKKRDWVGFRLRKNAQFHDGQPVTPEDVIWTFNTLITKADPLYAAYYSDIKKAEVWGKPKDRKIRFIFNNPNKELPYILGQLTIFPKHYWKKKKFEETTLEPPLGSGPYKVSKVSPGKYLEFKRVKNYWGNKVPVIRGKNNFATIRYDYYRNKDVIREALKSGKVTFFQENTAKNWATSYNIEVVENGRLHKEMIKDENPSGLQAFVFNTRKEIFKDPRVRLALNYAFDFEWLNKTIFYNGYIRANSYFNNSDFVTRELPDPSELKILNKLKKKYPKELPPEVFNQVYQPPKTDGSGNNRRNLRTAKKLFNEAGWSVKNGILTHEATGRKLEFEILIYLAGFDRIIQPYIKNLNKLGVKAHLKLLNPSQYQNRVRSYDFDLLSSGWGQSRSPGNEQYEFWGSKMADQKGSRNYIGIKSELIDHAIDLVVKAQTRKDLVTAVKVLDRILLWNHFVVPMWYFPYYRILYWDIFSKPKVKPKFDLGFDTWWVDEKKFKKTFR